MAFCFKNRRPQSMIYTPQIWHPQHFHKGILTPPPPPTPTPASLKSHAQIDFL